MRPKEKNTGAVTNNMQQGILTRRTLLQAGLLLAGTTVFKLPAAELAKQSAQFGLFMKASGLLIQHNLSQKVGGRLAVLLSRDIASFEEDLNIIIQIAERKQAQRVEDFFDELPDGNVKKTAYRIIFSWYSGVIDKSTTAEVVAFEDALMYKPTRDVTTVPTYSFNGPGKWVSIDPPLSDMPDF